MVDKPEPTFEEMSKWAEKAYELSIDELPAFIHQLTDMYNLSSIAKVNLTNISVTCILNNFYRENLFPMSEPEVNTSKWTLVKMLFPMLGDGPISLLKWNNLLSLTAEPYFHSMPRDVFTDVQASAHLLVERHEAGREQFSDEEIAHWKSIIDGQVPYGYRIIDEVAEPITPE